MKIFLIRHGETSANVEKKFAGFLDVPLNERGKEQAKVVSDKLKNEKIDAIYSSDLSRAFETAKSIASVHPVEIQSVPDLRELNFGLWEGKSYLDLQGEHSEDLKKWIEDYESFVIPEGESVLMLYQRVSEFFDKMKEKHGENSNQTVLLVAHGGVIQALLSHISYQNISGYWKFSIDNCGVNLVEYVMGYPVIKKLNA